MANDLELNKASGTFVADTFEQTDASHRQKVAIGGFGNNEQDVIGAITETAPASDTASSGLNGRLQRIAQRLGPGATMFAKAEDVASADADVGVPAMAVRQAVPANSSGTDGDYEFLKILAGRLWVSGLIDSVTAGALGLVKLEDSVSASGDALVAMGLVRRDTLVVGANASADGDYIHTIADNLGNLRTRSEGRMFSVAASAMTRPANTTPYSINDAVSNNATAGSVTAISFALSDANDSPITLERLRIDTTDTGAAGATFRAYFFNSDPTASTGVGGGDNAAWSQKKAGFIGSMTGTFRQFSDGCVAILYPDEGGRIISNPVSGAKTIFCLLQTLTGFTSSANSTTFTGTVEGFQGRA